MKRLLENLLLLAGSILAACTAGEVVIRVHDSFRSDDHFTDSRNEVANIKPLYPFLTFGFPLYAMHEGQVHISSRHGELYKLKKGPGTFRIVALGGSTTECLNLQQRYGTHYPRILQEMLQGSSRGNDTVEVINLGNAAYATPHLLILLALHVLSWDPDLVILSENINDLSAAYFPGLPFDYANKYSHEFYGIPNLRERLSLANQVFQHSRLYWSVKSAFVELEYRHGNRYEVRRIAYGNEPPGDAKAAFKRNLQSFIAIARSHGVKVVLGTQPLQDSEEYFLRHKAFKPYNDVIRYPLHGEFVRHHRAYNRVIMETASEENVDAVDTDAVFASRPELFEDYVHYSLEGANVLAKTYADHLLDVQAIPEAPAGAGQRWLKRSQR